MNSGIEENMVIYDWLSFTTKYHTPEEVIEAFGLHRSSLVNFDCLPQFFLTFSVEVASCRKSEIVLYYEYEIRLRGPA